MSFHKKLGSFLLGLVAFLSLPVSSQVPVSQLPQATLPLTGNESVVMNQNGTTKQGKVFSIASLVSLSAATGITLTPNPITGGAGTIGLTLPVLASWGGTGELGTITGIPKANGAGAFTAASFSDVPIPGSNTQFLFNNSGVLGAASSVTYTLASGLLTVGAPVSGSPLLITSLSNNILTNFSNAGTTSAQISYAGGNFNLGTLDATSLNFPVNNTSRLLLGSDGSYSVSSSVGTAGQVLASGGPGAPAGWSSAPALAVGPAGAVQFSNGSGLFQGLADLDFTSGTETLAIGSASTAPTLTTNALTTTGTFNISVGGVGATQVGQAIAVTAGTGGATAGNGGNLTLTAGAAAGVGNHPGGQAKLIGGSSLGTQPGGSATVQGGGSTVTTGGAANLVGGAGVAGGPVQLTGGSGTNGLGGGITISSVAGSTAGNNAGNISITAAAGNGAGNGGNVTITSGGTSGGTNGTVTINGSGGTAFNAPASGDTLTSTAIANQRPAVLKGSTTSGQSFGLFIQAGTTSADDALSVNNATNTGVFFKVDGGGGVRVKDYFLAFGAISTSGTSCNPSASTDLLNIIGCTRNSTGNYTVNFGRTTGLDYICTVTLDSTAGFVILTARATTSITVQTSNTSNTATDISFDMICW